jgi:NAD(P)H dehydrogenase (quinone)
VQIPASTKVLDRVIGGFDGRLAGQVGGEALTEEALDGITPPLTGPEAIDMAGIAAITTQLTGRPIRRVVVSDADYRAGLLAQGLPAPVADMLLGLFAASRLGHFAPADPTLARLLGRPTVTVADVLKATITPAAG